MKYSLSKEARRDVQRIWAHIVDENEAAAGRLVAAFVEKFEFLASRPNAGRLRDDARPGYRSFPVGNYVIFHRVVKRGVRIMRVIHGRRDLPNVLGD